MLCSSPWRSGIWADRSPSATRRSSSEATAGSPPSWRDTMRVTIRPSAIATITDAATTPVSTLRAPATACSPDSLVDFACVARSSIRLATMPSMLLIALRAPSLLTSAASPYLPAAARSATLSFCAR